jgi:uncharacterized protein
MALALAGGAFLSLTGAPAAWLTGGVLAVTFALGPLRLQAPSRSLTDSAMLLSGLLIGSTATPQAIAAAGRYPGSIAIMLIAVLVIMALTSLFLIRMGGWSRTEAVLSAAPGAFSTVAVLAVERKQNLSRIAIIQLFRLYMLLMALPAMVVGSGLVAVSPSPAAVPVIGPAAFAVLAACGLAGAFLFERLGVASPIILGATAASAILHATDVVDGNLPGPVAIMAFAMLAASIGGRFARIALRDVIKLMPVALGAFLISMGTAMLFAWPASLVAQVPLATAIVAFAPGALEAMAMLAFALELDPLYVAAHHLARFFAVGFGLPLLIGWIERGK